MQSQSFDLMYLYAAFLVTLGVPAVICVIAALRDR